MEGLSSTGLPRLVLVYSIFECEGDSEEKVKVKVVESTAKVLCQSALVECSFKG